jgi:hypothetical protein
MAPRKKTHPGVEADVLTASRRRCALCVGLEADFRVKLGQIDHLDGNPANSVFENLVFLCLDHHAQKSSKSNQAKGFLAREIRDYRDGLYLRFRTASAEPTDRLMDVWNKLKSAFKAVAERHQVSIDWKSFRLAADDLERTDVITHSVANRIRDLQELHKKSLLRD